jgi:peptide deformylase
MTILAITVVGDPVLRTPAAPVSASALADPDTQRFIDDLIETKRAANGAGLAANQVGDTRRIAVVEVEADNPRYPYKPPFPLTVLVNPRVVGRAAEELEINEGCLSVPDLRGSVLRNAEVEVEYEDREGATRRQTVRGLTAGTFQHEIDHLDGVLFLDRVRDPRSFSTWEMFDRHERAGFEARARALVERWGS